MTSSMASTYTIGVSHYKRFNNPDLPYHWAIMLRESKHRAWFYQIIGTPDTFELGPIELKNDFVKSGSFQGALKIGAIKASERERFEEVIKKVPIQLHSTDWNCQDWVVSALVRLQAAGLLPRNITYSKEAMLNDLKEVEDKFEMGEATYCDSD